MRESSFIADESNEKLNGFKSITFSHSKLVKFHTLNRLSSIECLINLFCELTKNSNDTMRTMSIQDAN